MKATTMKSLVAIFAILCVSAVAIHAQPPETKPSGIISGSVTSASGELPSNTIVYVSPVGSAVPPRSAVVTSNGTFKMEGLENGVYRVSASAPGFVSGNRAVISDNRGLYHTGDSVSLTVRKGGVITGKVINSNNAPVVAANVHAFLVRDENGKAMETAGSFREGFTDDRGVYRLFGLLPGSYIVSAGGMSRFFGGTGTTAYDQDAPTYAPSSARDTAMEISVRSGEEATADIQYRGEPGRAISGTLANVVQSQSGVSFGGTVNLADVKSRMMFISAPASSYNNFSFAFYGLPDGEYELVAQQFSQTRDIRASDPKRVKVQGADVTGITLALASLPSITGRVILDNNSTAECVKRRATALQETLLTIRRQKQPPKTTEAQEAATIPIPLTSTELITDAVPDTNGEFVLRNLRAGTYRLTVQLPSSAWYLRSVTFAGGVKGAGSKVISDGIPIKSQPVSGLGVMISEGAAAVRGSVTVGEGQGRPERAIVYLVPAEKESATNLLRYFEARVANDGSFAIGNVAPGDYFVVALKSEADGTTGITIREDSTLRNAVVREAEKSKQSLTLKPCERIDNYELTYAAATKP